MADELDDLLKGLPSSNGGGVTRGGGDPLDAVLASVPAMRKPGPMTLPVAPSITPLQQPAPAQPMMQSSVDPFTQNQDWIPGQPKPYVPKKPPMQAPESAVVAEAPGKIPQTVEMSPIGQTNAPIPGKIPGMERLGGVAPGVPAATRPVGEVNAPSLAGDVAGGFVRGAGNAAMSVPRVLSRLPGGFRDDLEALRPTPPNQEFIGAEARAAEDARNRQQMAGTISRAEQSVLPDAPLTVPGKLSEALGSTAPYMAAGAVGGNAATAALGVAGGVDEAMTRADMSGKPLTDTQRGLIGAGGAAIGSTEALPFARLLGKLKGAGVVAEAADDAGIAKQLFPGLKEYLTSAGKQGLEEGAQEGLSNVAQDAMESSYGARPTDKIGADFLENAGTGGAVGVFVDALTTLAGSHAGRARMREAGIDPNAFKQWADQQKQEKQIAVEDLLGVKTPLNTVAPTTETPGEVGESKNSKNSSAPIDPLDAIIAAAPQITQPSQSESAQNQQVAPIPAAEPEAESQSAPLGEQPPVAPKPEPNLSQVPTPEPREEVIQEPAESPAPVVDESLPPEPEGLEQPAGQDGPPTWAKAVKAVFGRRAPAKTARGYKVDTHLAVVPLSSLRISNTDSGEVNQDYPGQLQPRQRDRKSSDEQIQSIIDEFDPDQVAESYLATDGAPIIGEEDGAVESGNGRSMAIRRIYERFPDKANNYRQWMIDNADRFGMDANAIAQVDRPVLVRIRKGLPEGVTRVDFGRDANERTTQGMSPSEQASVDARAMGQNLIDMFKPNEDGEIDTTANVPFVTAFIDKLVPVSERNAMRSSDERLSTAGVRRIQNAIFAKAYNDRGMIERMSEDPDDNIKSIVNAMVAAAPRFISIRSAMERGDLHNLDIANDLTAAAGTLSRLRSEKKSIDDYLNQQDMFGRPEMQDAILTTMRDMGRSKAKFGDLLNRYMDAVEAAGNPKQVGMFGPAEVPTPRALWAGIVEKEQANAGGSEDVAAPGPVEGSDSSRGDAGGEKLPGKARRAKGPAAPEGPAERPAAGPGTALSNTVERTKDGLQETLVSDREARESQIAAKNDRNRPLAEVPFSLVAEEPPKPTGPDERQESMFGDEGGERLAYAPKSTGKSQPKSGKTGTMVARSEIVADLSRILNDIPIQTGNFRAPGALGIYDVRQNVVRTAKPLDLETIAHEIGHALHKHLWGFYEVKKRSGEGTGRYRLNPKSIKTFTKELGPLDYDPNRKDPVEGFAEYIRLRLSDPQQAQQRAPIFHRWFEKQLNNNTAIRDVLNKVAERINDWESQPAPVKMAASINVTPESSTALEALKEIINNFRFEMVDAGDDLKKVVNLMGQNGAPVEAKENAYNLFRTISGTFTRATHALMDGTIGGDNKVNGKGLHEIINPIAERPASEVNPKFAQFAKDLDMKMANDGMDDLRLYLVARRNADYVEQGFETGWTKDQIKEAIDATETPAIKAAAQEIHDFQDRVLEYMVEKGAMSAEVKDWINAKNQFYVPMYRVMDHQAGSNVLGRKMIDLNSPVMSRKGSQREVIDPLESIVRNTYSLYSFADRNAVGQALVKQAAKAQSMGAYIESGIVRPMKRTEFNLKEVEKQIREALESNGIDVEEDADFDVLAQIFRPNMEPSRKNGIVRVVVDGKPQLFQMAPEVIRSLDFMDDHGMNVMAKFFITPFKDLLTFGATAGNPEFILTNWFRDQTTAGMMTRNGYKPFISGLRGAFTLLTNPELVKEWELNGGASAAFVPLTRPNLRRSIDKMTMPTKDLILKHPGEMWQIFKAALTYLGGKSEQATRIEEYRLARKAGKSEIESAMDSRDVTLDFERMGRLARIINKGIPFFAASINGVDRFVEMHRENPGKAVYRGMGLAAFTMALWMLNKDDEDYLALEPWKRDLFWLIPTKGIIPRSWHGPFIRIPKPPLWGWLYGTTVERTANWMHGKDPRAFDDAYKSIVEQLLPPMTMQTIRPAFEAMVNYNLFTDRPIESPDMQRMSPVNRYNPSTSEAAKKIARALDSVGLGVISPAKLEHIYLGYTAGLGRLAMNVTEELTGARKNRPTMGPADRPILRAFSTPDTPFMSTNYTLFDKRRRKLEQRSNDVKRAGDMSKKLTAKEESDLRELNALMKEFSQLRRRQYDIERSTGLSRDQKREQIDAIARTREQRLRQNTRLFAR